MTTSATAPPAPPPRIGALRHAGALAQLAAVGAVGTLVFALLAVLLGAGLGLLLVVGIGILFLLAFLYLLWASAWLENERVDGLYGYGLPPLPTRRSGLPGFGGLVRTLWEQFTDGRMWRGVASAAVSTVLGIVVLTLVSWLVTSVVLVFTPLLGGDEVRIPATGLRIGPEWALPAGIIGALVAAALLVGVALLHALLTRAILVPSREALLAEQARVSGVQREGAVRAGEVERSRIERDLHDGVQPRLVSVGMTLGLAQQKLDTDPAAARALIDEAHTSTKAAITELRQLARGIHASVLDDRGLDAALSALATRSHLPVHLDVRLDRRCSPAADWTASPTASSPPAAPCTWTAPPAARPRWR